MTPAIAIPNDVAPWPDALIEVLERQQGLVEQLASLSQAQGSLISERRTDHLLQLLSQRQELIDEFTVCQAQMSAMSQDLDRRMTAAAAPQRERIRTLIASISLRLREVMQRDHDDQAALHGGRDATLAEMTGLDAARVARTAYGPTVPNAALGGSRFADHRG